MVTFVCGFVRTVRNVQHITCSLEGGVALATQIQYAAEAAVYAVPRDLASKLIGFGTYKTAGRTLGPFSPYFASRSAVYSVSGQTGLERLDVAACLQAPGLLGAGFQVDVDLKGVPPGEYAV